jgi:hypothetical protein
MSIDTGFYTYSCQRAPHVATAAKKAYAALSSSMKTFFHETLPPLMMATGVGVITPETVKVLSKRLLAVSPVYAISVANAVCKAAKLGPATNDDAAVEALQKFFTPFIGVVSNVHCLTDHEFLKHNNAFSFDMKAQDVDEAMKWAENNLKTLETA